MSESLIVIELELELAHLLIITWYVGSHTRTRARAHAALIGY